MYVIANLLNNRIRLSVAWLTACHLKWFVEKYAVQKIVWFVWLFHFICFFFLQEIANTEKLRFLNESVAVRKEAAKLKGEGVDIIIVLSHCGLDVDYIIAKNAGPDVDVIVGGHSHTFMYTNTDGESPPGPDTPKDNYPAVVTHDDGHKVLIVQASAYLKYIGDITVYFDKQGRVVSWEGAPIFLDTNVAQGIGIWMDKSLILLILYVGSVIFYFWILI